MSELETNKEVVRQYVDAFNRADYDALRCLFAPDAVVQGVLGSSFGPPTRKPKACQKVAGS